MGRERDGLWLDRFFEPLPISAEGAFRLTAARDTRTGRPVVVVTAGPMADRRPAASALVAFHEAHARDVHPVVARAIDLGEADDATYVVLDCPARVDLGRLLTVGRESGARLSHAEADGFISELRAGLVAASEVGVPALGTLGYANVLFALDGRFWLVGFGHNVPLADEHGRIGGRGTMFQAPEVAVGAPGSVGADYVALLLFMRSLISFVRMDWRVARVFAGNSLAEDLELIRRIRWIDANVVSGPPEKRPPIAEALANSVRIREILGLEMDIDGFRREVGKVFAHLHAGELREASAWRVTAGGASVAPAGRDRVSITSRHLRNLVVVLAQSRIDRPGSGLSTSELVAAGWPGERVSARSGANRVYVAVSQLRKLVFGRDLESADGRYRLSPSIVVTIEPELEHARAV